MLDYQSRSVTTFYARPIRRRLGWWTVLPLWGIIARTVIMLTLAVAIATTAQEYLNERVNQAASEQTSLPDTLLLLSDSMDGFIETLKKGAGIQVEQWEWESAHNLSGLRRGSNIEALGLEVALRQVGGNLGRVLSDPFDVLRTIERNADVVVADGRRVARIVGGAVEDGDQWIRTQGRMLMARTVQPAWTAFEQFVLSHQ